MPPRRARTSCHTHRVRRGDRLRSHRPTDRASISRGRRGARHQCARSGSASAHPPLLAYGGHDVDGEAERLVLGGDGSLGSLFGAGNAGNAHERSRELDQLGTEGIDGGVNARGVERRRFRWGRAHSATWFGVVAMADMGRQHGGGKWYTATVHWRTTYRGTIVPRRWWMPR